MSAARSRLTQLPLLVLLTHWASAEDRLNDGITLSRLLLVRSIRSLQEFADRNQPDQMPGYVCL